MLKATPILASPNLAKVIFNQTYSAPKHAIGWSLRLSLQLECHIPLNSRLEPVNQANLRQQHLVQTFGVIPAGYVRRRQSRTADIADMALPPVNALLLNRDHGTQEWRNVDACCLLCF